MTDAVASFGARPHVVAVLAPVTARERREAIGRSHTEPVALILDPADEDLLRRAVQAPVVALFPHVPDAQELTAAADVLENDGVYVHPSFASALLGLARRELRGPDVLETLTERELEIARLLVRSRSNRAIAAALYLSEHTVRNHLARLYRKLDVATRQDAAEVLVRAFEGRARADADTPQAPSLRGDQRSTPQSD